MSKRTEAQAREAVAGLLDRVADAYLRELDGDGIGPNDDALDAIRRANYAAFLIRTTKADGKPPAIIDAIGYDAEAGKVHRLLGWMRPLGNARDACRGWLPDAVDEAYTGVCALAGIIGVEAARCLTFPEEAIGKRYAPTT